MSTPQARHLTPFVKGDGRAADAGRKSAAARAARRAAGRVDVGEIVGDLRTLATASQGVDVSATCIGVVVWALSRVTNGEVPLRHGGDVAELVRVLVDVARLAGGQPDSVSAVVHLSAADARARLAELAAVAAGLDVGPVLDVGEPPAGAVSAAATAVADGQHGGGPSSGLDGPVLDVVDGPATPS